MSDIIYDWIKSLGADKKDVHGVCERMDFVCRHFDLVNPCLPKHLNKKMFKRIIAALEKGEVITRERFITLSLLAFEPEDKWNPDHIAFCRSKNFYRSQKWRNLRLKALAKSNICTGCGRSPKDGVVLHVDHVLPRSIYPEYALVLGNLQILCEDCNLGKGNTITKRF